MKFKQLLLSLFAIFAVTTAMADVTIDETRFPDANFRQFIKGEWYGSDGVLTSDEIAEIINIDVSSKYIQSLKGIEYFTAVSTLNCKSNQLTTLDLSKNKELRALDCSANQLTTLDLLWNSGLYRVDCSSNKLTTLNVSSCTQMTELRCQSNQLTVLNLSNNTDLITLYCSNNQLTSLDVSNCNALTSIYCENNQLTELAIGNNTHLTSLTCSNNKMTTLDLSGCTSLRTLSSMNGQLTSLNVAGTKLTDLYCTSNQIAALDLSGLTTLTTLDCSDNKLKTLNMSSCTKLTLVNCSKNLINNEGMDSLVQNLPTVSAGSLNVRYGYSEGNVMTTTQVADAKTKGWTPKTWNSNLYTWEDYAGVEPTPTPPTPPTPSGESIDINDETTFPDIRFRNFLKSQPYGSDEILTAEEIASITSMNMIGRYIESIKGIENFTALAILSCGSNKLTEIDVSKNVALTSLSCSDNQLTYLDLSKNAALTGLDCSMNLLTALDVSGCPLLTSLSCNQNQIKDTAMDSLVQSLPVTSNGNMRVYYTTWTWKEQNVMTTVQVAAAKAKGWTPLWMDPSSGWVEYAGTEPVNNIHAITNSQEVMGDVYDLQGRRVAKPQHGVNIIRDSDGTTKRVMIR